MVLRMRTWSLRGASGSEASDLGALVQSGSALRARTPRPVRIAHSRPRSSRFISRMPVRDCGGPVMPPKAPPTGSMPVMRIAERASGWRVPK